MGVLCSHCQSLSLYYTPGGEPVLGLESLPSSIQSTLDSTGDRLTIGKEPAFFLDTKQSTVGWVINEEENDVLHFNEIAHIAVRQQGGLRTKPGGLKGLRRAWAYSSGVTLTSLLFSMLPGKPSPVHFSVILYPKSGAPRLVTDHFGSPADAFSLQHQIRNTIFPEST